MNLSKHFTLSELTRTSHRQFDNTPGAAEIENLKRLCLLLEDVKKSVGMKPVMITSGYRSAEVNAAVGSKPTSQHRLGCAADFRVPGMTPREVMEAIIVSGVNFDQSILEFDSWVHISVPNSSNTIPRLESLIIDKSGVRPYA